LKLELSRTLQKTENENTLNKSKKRKTVSIKRFKVMQDGSKVEVPLTPLSVDSGFKFKTKERKACMTPEGKKVVKLVRTISKSRPHSLDLVQPLDLLPTDNLFTKKSSPVAFKITLP